MPEPHGQEDVEIVSHGARRRRSPISRHARSSPWGSLGFSAFETTMEPVHPPDVNGAEVNGSAKRKGSRGRAKRNKSQASEKSRGSKKQPKEKCGTPITRIRLKVKLGSAVNQNCAGVSVPEVVDPSVSASAAVGNCEAESFWAANLEPVRVLDDIEEKRASGGTSNDSPSPSVKPGKEEACDDEPVSNGHYGAIDCHSTVIEQKTSISNGDHGSNDCLSTVIEQKSSSEHVDDFLGDSSHMVEPLERASGTGCFDHGTSPDSEVVNSVSDAQASVRLPGDWPDSGLTSPKKIAASGKPKGRKKGKKDRIYSAGGCPPVDGTGVSANKRSKVKSSKKRNSKRNAGDELCSSETVTSSITANASSCSPVSKDLSTELLPLLRETEIEGEAQNVDAAIEAEACFEKDVGSGLPESQARDILTPKRSRQKLSKNSKSIKASKGRSKASNTANNRSGRLKDNQRKSLSKSKIKENGVLDPVEAVAACSSEIGNSIVDSVGKTNDGSIASKVATNLDVAAGVMGEQHLPPRNAWVLCDECHKWRRIPATLVDSIGQANCTWTCNDNIDKDFADCSIPQEKSNAEINAELEISDASGEEDGSDIHRSYRRLGYQRPMVSKQHTFTSIDSNQFLHRNRKTQTIDEIMVCHCKPSPEGRLGCGDECLNRMLNIECVQGTCPCGDLCSNQQFQRRKYEKLEWFRCGKKGYGLRSLDNISQGQFLIEYVGEVLDMLAYEARQKEYALNGHRHFYFMTLNGSEVIDACAKGNLGRFINHSCDPNCRTEKWMVNGEICIGLFALRDIKKGEEVTFDYNYVRVFGAAAKKCYCGSSQCRGYIGGDPLNSEVIIQSDSDEEYPEPTMLLEDGKTADSLLIGANYLDASEVQNVENITDGDKMNNGITTVRKIKITTGKGDPNNYPASTIGQQDTSAIGETLNQSPSLVEREESRCPTLSIGKPISEDKKSKPDIVEDKLVVTKPRPRMKTYSKPGSVKKVKVACSPLNLNKVQLTANKPQIFPMKPKKLIEGSSSGRIEAVEEKLHELLDAEGGISKRKDAARGYLKLLLLTAASGDRCNGEAIQSNRDLSMILDALLKTKSRTLLIDIINKNGLRMLHNIMKQYRRDFKKIPILRKLLKVLEYLAVREVLTSEHINGGPPCLGMESFRESMLSLTEHDDKQVHQIARSFRDRWIPKHLRKFGYTERDDGRIEVVRGLDCSNRMSASQSYRHGPDARPTEAIDCVKQSVFAASSADAHLSGDCSATLLGGPSMNGTKPRKRKTRWDQDYPVEVDLDSKSPQRKEQKIEPGLQQQSEPAPSDIVNQVNLDDADKVRGEDRSSSACVQSLSQEEDCTMDDNEKPTISEDVPPGFSSPLNPPQASTSALETTTDQSDFDAGHSTCAFATFGHPQEKFISRMPVSYGIPLSVVQQFGIPRDENLDKWAIAPGMPFEPFPPLPPFPRGKRDPPAGCGASNRSAEERQLGGCGRNCFPDERSPSMAGAHRPDLDSSSSNRQQMSKRFKGSSYDMGRRYFRQQKWNNMKLGPPWLRKKNGWGYSGSNNQGGANTVGIRNGANESKNSYCADVGYRGDRAGNDFFQHSQAQNQY